MKKVLCDLDGTLALIEHRRHFVEGDSKDWPAFFAACVNDEPNKPVIELVNSLYEFVYEIIIVTGRSDEVSDLTRFWLDKHEVRYNQLIMRRYGNHVTDLVLKRRLIEEHCWTPGNTLCVLEDRNRLVEMWRDEGFTCLQVAEGDF